MTLVNSCYKRVRSEERLKKPVGAASQVLIRVTGEDLLDGHRIAEEDHWRVARQPHRERVAVAFPTRMHEWERSEDPPEQLKKARDAWPGGQLGHRQTHGPIIALLGSAPNCRRSSRCSPAS